jgi:hypothetical protein
MLPKNERLQQPLMEVVARDFAELPQDILMDMFSLLETPDLVRAGSVCCSWKAGTRRILAYVALGFTNGPKHLASSTPLDLLEIMLLSSSASWRRGPTN